MTLLRQVLIGFGALFVTLLLALGGGLIWLSRSLPMTEGMIAISGLEQEIDLLRDGNGVVHVRAESAGDAYFGLGFAHAQDRLWQMELGRRAGAGRLSEIFGARTLDSDKFLRTLALYRHAEASLKTLAPDSRALLERYAAGVNAFLANHEGPLPLEFLAFNHRPEPWQPADSIVAVKMMALLLSGNARDELLRAQLSRRLTPTQVADLWPPYADDPAVRVSDVPPDVLPGLVGGAGSNNWVISGAHTESGFPLLANDPHLGLTVPSYWYLAHLQAPGLNVLGGTLPGIPGIISGRNSDVAWGVTNTGPDVQDVFIERIDPSDPSRYATPDGYRDFESREETIRVKGGDDLRLTVRETRHGPVMSDVNVDYAAATDQGTVAALAWTAFADDDRTVEAGLNLATAATLAEAMEVLALFHVPQQNFVIADSQGNIGFVAAGRVPVRNSSDGWMPAEGWTRDGDWIDVIPYDALPRATNPHSGRLITANQKVVDDGYPYLITRIWQSPYRAQRIADLIAEHNPHGQRDSAAIQTDIRSRMAAEILPLLLRAPVEGPSRPLRDLLEKWDGGMDPELAEPLIFHAWYRALTIRVAGDELGSLFRKSWSYRPAFLARVLTARDGWCDDVDTVETESCDDQIAAALDDARGWIQSRHGTSVDQWRWGDAHVAHSRHQTFSALPVIGALFDIRRRHGGGPYTVMQANVRLSDEEAPFREIHGASLRLIMDLGDRDSTLAITNTGQSGNRFSKHYDDFADPWVAGDYVTIPMSDAAVDAATKSRLILRPAGG